jgi:4-amino-4-deoxy-L-arabinose transferase
MAPESLARSAIPLLLFALLYLLPLGERPLFWPDEFRYAEIPREMLASGDWVVPRLNGLRYFEKPPLGYWLTATSLAVFGENPFAVRLPSALAAGGSALLVFLLLRRFGPGGPTASLSALVLLTSLLPFLLGVYSVLDGPLGLWLTGALVAFYFAYRAEDAVRRHVMLALFGAACGLAFLTKGFLAFAVPVAVIVPFLLWEGRWRALFTWFWMPIAVAGLVALPWALAVHAREPDFWHYFFWVEHIQRFSGDDAQHAEPFWFYLPILIVGALPWTLAWPAAVAGLRGRPPDSLQRYAVLWVVMPLLFYSASRGKLPTYVQTCLPGLALLTALGLQRYLDSGRDRLVRLGAWGGAALLLVLGLAFGLVTVLRPADPLFGAGESAKLWWLLAACALGALLFFRAVRAPPSVKAMLFAAAPAALFVALQYNLPSRVLDIKAPERQVREWASQIPHDAVLVADVSLVHAVAWVFRRDDVHMLEKGELDYGLSYPDAAGRHVPLGRLGAFLAQQPDRPVAVFRKLDPKEPADRGKPEGGARVSQGGRFALWYWPVGS